MGTTLSKIDKKNKIIKKQTKLDRVQKAKNHTDYVGKHYKKEIQECSRNSVIYTEIDLFNTSVLPKGRYTITITEDDSVAAILNSSKKQCLLNFASFKNPGGGFLVGSMAQEEALCHESFLYNVLLTKQEEFYEVNKKMDTYALYSNRAIYTPNVLFERSGKKAITDVITCACPNYGAAQTKGITEQENNKVLKDRIHYILSIMSQYPLERIILGAYGCGAFRQNPKTVARIFKEEIKTVFRNKQLEIVFAIPKGNGNYEAFKEEFSK